MFALVICIRRIDECYEASFCLKELPICILVAYSESCKFQIMALHTIEGKKVILPDFNYSKMYWPIISQIIEDEVGVEEVKDAALVQDLLKKCFAQLCLILEEKIKAQNRVTFFMCCQYLHEDSTDIWIRQTQGYKLSVSEEDFAASRRVLKIILEQSTKLDLVGCNNFLTELQRNTEVYVLALEEMLYLGYWCIILSENIARSQLFPLSIGLQIEEGELSILTYQPYPELYKFIFTDMPRHNSKVALSDSIHGFKDTIQNNFGITYDSLSSFILSKAKAPGYRFSLANLKQSIYEFVKESGVGDADEAFIRSFYAGLTVSKRNCLPLDKCIYNNQDQHRHIYRPILELTVDGKIYNLIGYNKWRESFTTLTTNCFPFGIIPDEWKQFKPLKDFIHRVDNEHDKILIDPIATILTQNEIFFEIDIDSFNTGTGTNVNIKNSIGDIDVLFIEPDQRRIYVTECKHNRSRFDLNNWKRDYANFTDKYEEQLKRKLEWVTYNKKTVETHFRETFGDFDTNLSEFEVIGIFAINAPTIYMYNGQYRAFTIQDISDLVSIGYRDVKFNFTSERTGESYFIEHPYFDNIELKMANT